MINIYTAKDLDGNNFAVCKVLGYPALEFSPAPKTVPFAMFVNGILRRRTQTRGWALWEANLLAKMDLVWQKSKESDLSQFTQ